MTHGRLFCHHQSRTVGLFLDYDADGIVRQEVLNQFGPLNETEVATVEVVLVTHIIDFFYPLDAIEVEVVEGGVGGGIFIHDGEGWGGDDIGDT